MKLVLFFAMSSFFIASAFAAGPSGPRTITCETQGLSPVYILVLRSNNGTTFSGQLTKQDETVMATYTDVNVNPSVAGNDFSEPQNGLNLWISTQATPDSGGFVSTLGAGDFVTWSNSKSNAICNSL